MGVMSILLTVSGTALIRMYKQQSVMLQTLDNGAAWKRLARDFRTDVHSAENVSPAAGDTNRIDLTIDGRPVAWIVDGELIRRVTATNDASEIEINAAGERYVFPDSTLELAISEANAGQSSIVTVVVRAGSESRDSQTGSGSIKAVAGFDHRFRSTEAGDRS